jgi:VCBS repeat-containing protein
MPADTTAPRVQSFAASDPSTTNASVVHYTLTFSEPVTGVGTGSFGLVTSGVSGASVASVTAVGGSNGAQYVIAVNTGTGDGSIALDLSSAGIEDLAGNRLAGTAFQPETSYPTGRIPESVAIGDLNGDGKPDLVVANFFSSDINTPATISVLLGNGDGTFQPQTTYPAGLNAYSVAIGDFNKDGKPDVVVANNAATATPLGTLSVLLGNGDGSFQSPTAYPTGPGPISVATGDFNGDGNLDLVAANGSFLSNSVSVLLGNGNGTFQPQTMYAVGVTPFAVAVGDLNGDGKLDLVTANTEFGPDVNPGSLSVLLGNGDGTFQPKTDYATTGHLTLSVAIGDLNADGKPDLVAVNNATETMSLFFGNGDGTFQPEVVYSTGAGGPGAVAITDQDGDGKLDLVITNGNSSTVALFLGNGDGTFQAPDSYAAGVGPKFSAVGDLNGDGRPDVATVSGSFEGASAARVSILLNDPALQGPAYTIDKTSAPVAANGSATGNEDTLITGTLVATDVDGDPLTFSRVTQAAHGTVAVNADGSFSYTPNANYNGPDSFTFKANDGLADSNVATETLTVRAVNDAPVAANGSAGGDENTVINGTLVATDIDSASLTFSRVAQATHGSVTVNANGSFSYTPNIGYSGTDSFTFKANDGSLDSNVATVGLTVADTAIVDDSLAPPHLPQGSVSSSDFHLV